jgi:hypothetical protein
VFGLTVLSVLFLPSESYGAGVFRSRPNPYSGKAGKKKNHDGKQSTSIVGRFDFDGHAEAWVQCCAHHPMQHFQCYTGSLWTPPLGDYLLYIDRGAGSKIDK